MIQEAVLIIVYQPLNQCLEIVYKICVGCCILLMIAWELDEDKKWDHLECQEGRPGVCKYEDCPGQQQIFFLQNGKQRGPQPHETRYKCMKCSIDQKKNMYFCKDITAGQTTVKRCHLLHFCTNTTTADNTDDKTDGDNN